MYCLCVNVYCHRVTTQLQLINIILHQNFYGKGLHCLLRSGSWSACAQIAVNDIPNNINHCVTLMVHKEFRHLADGRHNKS
jgi:hypothetical protein